MNKLAHSRYSEGKRPGWFPRINCSDTSSILLHHTIMETGQLKVYEIVIVIKCGKTLFFTNVFGMAAGTLVTDGFLSGKLA